MESVSKERRLCRGLNDVCFLREKEGKATAGEPAGPISVPTTNHRVPHISLVFGEMWDTTAADRHFSALQELPIEVCGIPHLAKNERDMGHPMIRGRDRNWTGRFSCCCFSFLLTRALYPCNRRGETVRALHTVTLSTRGCFRKARTLPPRIQ
jgi:hypothetical protein